MSEASPPALPLFFGSVSIARPVHKGKLQPGDARPHKIINRLAASHVTFWIGRAALTPT
jgi:hypothetical protein